MKSPISNLSPIIVLPVLRKAVAVFMRDKKINLRLDSAILISQTTYHKNRSTTEHVFPTKLIVEGRIPSRKETLCFFLLDINKAFNSMHKNTSVEDLKNILNQIVLNLIQILLDVKIRDK